VNLKRRGCEVEKLLELKSGHLGAIKDHEILGQLYNKDTATNIFSTILEIDKNFCVYRELSSKMSVG
jgi:hypothetical protein